MPGFAKSFTATAASLALALGLAAFAPGNALAGDPSALWKIVHDQCVPDQNMNANPAPCALVDLDQHYAVLKDIRGATQFLLIPIERINGIESPEILNETPNFWQDAWQAKHFVESRAGRAIPREDLGLAINSEFARSQNQLHIHIDCIRADVKLALHEHESQISDRWSTLDFPLNGRIYQALRLTGDDLRGKNPFQLLAQGNADARANMGKETIAVIGANFTDGNNGFYILSDHADLLKLDPGASESLLDHECAVLSQTAAQAPATLSSKADLELLEEDKIKQ
jgi:CDP-diacylglycerol pyrophosphatase